MIRRETRLAFLTALGLFSAALLLTEAEAATLAGAVKVEGDKSLKNVIVYLEPADAATKAAVHHQRVQQKGRMFTPGLSVVVAGGSVTFVNDEEQDIDHNVYSLSTARRFDIGLARKGTEISVDFPTPGVVKFFCSVHKNMEGTVVVVPSPYYVVLTKPGQFVIENVPPGHWKLNAAVSHRRYTAAPVAVALREGESAAVDLMINRKTHKR